MFIKRVRIKGYQALYDIELECSNFTVVYGESDVGKSACYRALRAVITNEQGDSFISRGLDKAEVLFTLASGDEITWIKPRTRSADYILNGNRYLRPKGVPADIASKIKINPVVVDSEKFYPNLRGQFDSLFMLFESASKRARLLGSLVSNILLGGIKSANLERYRTEADIRASQDLWDELDRRSKFDWVSVSTKLVSVRKVLEQIKLATFKFLTLRELVLRKSQLSVYAHVRPVEVPLVEDLDGLVNSHYTLSSLLMQKQHLLTKIQAMDNTVLNVQGDLINWEKEKDELAGKLKISCPSCGVEISLTEVSL